MKFSAFALVCDCCDQIIPGTSESNYYQAINHQARYPAGQTSVIGWVRVRTKPEAENEKPATETRGDPL